MNESNACGSCAVHSCGISTAVCVESEPQTGQKQQSQRPGRSAEAALSASRSSFTLVRGEVVCRNGSLMCEWVLVLIERSSAVVRGFWAK